jgi:signal transduction histidine kinase
MNPISGFFQSNIILIFFVYGLAFFLMGLVIVIESRRTSALSLANSLWLLGGFGLLNGLVGWADMFMAVPRHMPGPPTTILFHQIQPLNCFQCHQQVVAGKLVVGWGSEPYLEVLKTIFLVGAPLLLLYFGTRLLQDTKGANPWLRWAPLSLLALWLAATVLGRDLSGTGMQERLITAGIMARYLLYVPAAALGAAAFLSQRPIFQQLRLPRIAREASWASLVFALGGLFDGLVVPPAPFIPASLLNYASFFALSGIPVQAFRAATATAIVYLVLRILRIFQIEYQRRLEKANEERFQAQQEALAAQKRAQEQLEQWNRELEERIRQRTQEIEQRNRDLAILEERDRLAREMHDGLAQILGYLNLKVLATEQMLSAGKTPQAREELQRMEKAVQGACADVREAILSLRTTISPQKGLVPTLAEFLEQFSDQTGLKVELASAKVEQLSLPLETQFQLLRIIQEALTNVRKHAQATQARVKIEEGPEWVTIKVEDNGQGFDPAPKDQKKGHRFGLQIMRERAEGIGGRLTVQSKPGQGTRIVVKVPRRERNGIDDGTYQRAASG